MEPARSEPVEPPPAFEDGLGGLRPIERMRSIDWAVRIEWVGGRLAWGQPADPKRKGSSIPSRDPLARHRDDTHMRASIDRRGEEGASKSNLRRPAPCPILRRKGAARAAAPGQVESSGHNFGAFVPIEFGRSSHCAQPHERVERIHGLPVSIDSRWVSISRLIHIHTYIHYITADTYTYNPSSYYSSSSDAGPAASSAQTSSCLCVCVVRTVNRSINQSTTPNPSIKLPCTHRTASAAEYRARHSARPPSSVASTRPLYASRMRSIPLPALLLLLRPHASSTRRLA